MNEAEAVAVLRAADPAFGPVADTLLELADDDTVSPELYDRVCSAVFGVLNAWAELAGRDGDPRHAEPVGIGEVAGLVVAFKALVLRAGGRVEITEAELLEARELLARVDATPERMLVELVEGSPPDVPRFAAEGA